VGAQEVEIVTCILLPEFLFANLSSGIVSAWRREVIMWELLRAGWAAGLSRSDDGRSKAKAWTFLTNHARVLIGITRNPQARVRDVADYVGITERATQVIIGDLEEASYLTRSRIGRRNTYTVNPDRPFRHPAEADHDVQDLIALFAGHDDEHLARPAVHPHATDERTSRNER
jgi:hypothetical protein